MQVNLFFIESDKRDNQPHKNGIIFISINEDSFIPECRIDFNTMINQFHILLHCIMYKILIENRHTK